MTKYVFVTGGVVSSLGKGIASASLGAILESRGLKVTLIKLDPYLNVDPGTMSPFQHGEVFVTDDGAETDLDLGHYERFISTRMKRSNNFTTGQIYKSRAREGAPRRLPRQDGAGDPARHQRDPGVRQARRGRCRCRDRRDRRHRRRHRVAALPRGGAPDGAARRPEQLGLRAPDLRALDRRRRRAQDQADPAHGAEDARDRHPARRAAVPRRPRDPRRRARQDLAVHQRRPAGRDLDVGRRHDLQGAAHAARAAPRRADLHEAAAADQARRPAALGPPGARTGAPASSRCGSRCAASTPTCRTRTSR